MNRPPLKCIKDLPEGPEKTILLQFIEEETSNKDEEDHEMDLLNPSLAAIENASEIARRIFQSKGVFEKITDSIRAECACRVPITRKCIDVNGLTKAKLPKTNHFVHLSQDILVNNESVGGHYAGLVVNSTTTTVHINDSMGKKAGPYRTFINAIKKAYPGYKINFVSSGQLPPQPTGGFVQTSRNNYIAAVKSELINLPANPETLDQWYEIHKMDQMSQHHFCYIESLVYLCSKLLGSTKGLPDPRTRIYYIKRVCLALMKKFNLVPDFGKEDNKNKTKSKIVKKYLDDTFPYSLFILNNDNKMLNLKKGIYQTPNIEATNSTTKIYKPLLVKIDTSFLNTINETTSMKDLMDLALHPQAKLNNSIA